MFSFTIFSYFMRSFTERYHFALTHHINNPLEHSYTSAGEEKQRIMSFNKTDLLETFLMKGEICQDKHQEFDVDRFMKGKIGGQNHFLAQEYHVRHLWSVSQPCPDMTHLLTNQKAG